MLKLKAPVLLIQKGTGILKVLGSGSFRKSWVLLDYTTLERFGEGTEIGDLASPFAWIPIGVDTLK